MIADAEAGFADGIDVVPPPDRPWRGAAAAAAVAGFGAWVVIGGEALPSQAQFGIIASAAGLQTGGSDAALALALSAAILLLAWRFRASAFGAAAASVRACAATSGCWSWLWRWC